MYAIAHVMIVLLTMMWLLNAMGSMMIMVIYLLLQMVHHDVMVLVYSPLMMVMMSLVMMTMTSDYLRHDCYRIMMVNYWLDAYDYHYHYN